MTLKQQVHRKAFTIIEVLIVVIILSIITIILLCTLKPNDFKEESLKTSGLNFYNELDKVTKNIILNYATNYSLTSLKNDDSVIVSIDGVGQKSNFYALYYYLLPFKRMTSCTLSSEYKKLQLTKDYTVDDFIKDDYLHSELKNGVVIGLKLHESCEISETEVYSPIKPDSREEENSCGLFFFDLNGEEKPNELGIDMYLVPIGKLGLK